MAVRPSSFEPTRRVHVEDSTDDSDIEDNLNHLRAEPSWKYIVVFLCAVYSTSYRTKRECVCCQELEDVLCILSQESVRLTCIVDHPEFATVCLNPLVYRVALAGIS